MKENLAARRRDKLDLNYLSRHPIPASPPRIGEISTATLIREELEAFGIDNTPNYSEGNLVSRVLNEVDVNNPSESQAPDILRSLLWRGQQQSKVFQTFMALCQHGLDHLSALSKRVDYYNFTPTSIWIHNALMSFSAFGPLYERGSAVVDLEEPLFTEWMAFEYPLVWLEVMLVRSAASIGDTFDAITATGLLGTFDKARFDKIPKLEWDWSPEPDTVSTEALDSPCFGLMLPSGIDVSNTTLEGIQGTFYQRFNKVEGAFEEYFMAPAQKSFSLQ